jgi:hypothetical protein
MPDLRARPSHTSGAADPLALLLRQAVRRTEDALVADWLRRFLDHGEAAHGQVLIDVSRVKERTA